MTTATPDTIDIDNTVALHADLTAIIRGHQQCPETEASALAAAVVSGLKARYGGEALYVPRGLSLRERNARNKDIRARFNGRNGPELCREHDISRSQLYRIVGRQP